MTSPTPFPPASGHGVTRADVSPNPLATLYPTAADTAAATRFIDDEYRQQVCPIYFANHRERLVRMSAVAFMQKRQHAEHRAEIQRRASASKARAAA